MIDVMTRNNDYSHLRAPGVSERPALTRRSPRVIAGVARGLSVHLGGSVVAWRWAFVLATPFFGVGVMAYVVLAVSMPQDSGLCARRRRLIPALANTPEVKNTNRRPLFLTALILLASAVGIALVNGGYGGNLIPVLIILAGAGIAWSHPVGNDSAPIGWTITGALIAISGALTFTSTQYGFYQTMASLGVGLAVVAALAVVVLPVLLHNRTQLRDEYTQRIRESERADIAAHLHDSVLQTLALIRSRADSPEEVASLARAQERDLRRYLYSDRAVEGTSVADDIAHIAADTDEKFHTEIDVVVTGDAQPSSLTQALLGASREALTNAAKHAPGKISLFAQLSDEVCEVFVRDRGPGFDVDTIPSDRAGIRDSIRGRLAKVGGEVEIRSPLPSGGSEVRMRVVKGSAS
ncbi:ATP-binding protein [Arcanobacterium buesumense]|nr:ATP-binding protein [Arcanobacterium buesumense]